ncbi:hypothetical protein [Paracoccus litorisediminis]|uniref:Uncharacterized protein n=1 Tax=Paracoccus litorisediminis TaxID=2006130 RepID=A0A844HST8_9RHOB|nr:hypothetical protein [Paracoccus litorisediminis]MTH62158.1 hypothetical protein [Paracoccus litorisediminis]
MTRPTFDTRDYERSWGRTPRGRGSWAFATETDDWILSPSLTYTEAKRWAREQRPEADHFTVGS